MAMKQTQTKYFDFSDVGLDFCAGSKNLFPDRFKKMLALGYNEQTVTSVVVLGNQITFTYGGAHGYVANRVLKVDSGPLSLINGGEFWIDSVTTNTVTLTIDDAPISLAGGFITKIAPLGWQLVYEQNHIHIYKFKHIDDSDMYARFCFQNATTAGNRNCIAVGIGRTVDLALGHITDPNCFGDLGTCETALSSTSNVKWDFTASTAATFNNYTYSQGYSTFGSGVIVGSLYHLIVMHNVSSATPATYTQGIIAASTLNYDVINYPLLLASNNGASTTTSNTSQPTRAYLGQTRCIFNSVAGSDYVVNLELAASSYLPDNIDGFNTTTAYSAPIYEMTTRQHLGYCNNFYLAAYNTSNRPSRTYQSTPAQTYDIDLNNIGLTHHLCTTNGSSTATILTMVEEVKIGT